MAQYNENNRRAKYNALYNSYVDFYGEIEDCIILPYMKDSEEYSPEYIFLHELGHLLSARITRKQDTAPTSFEFWENQIFSRNKAAKTEHTQAELFCDCFAVAALYETQYEKHAVFDKVKAWDKALLSNYFHVLMDTLDQNPGGTLSWDEIQRLHSKR